MSDPVRQRFEASPAAVREARVFLQAAMAGRVVAHPDSRLRLPEVGFGLVPGAGGTASVPLRIGRARTAWLALSGSTLDAATSLRWGLVDALDG